MKPARYLMLALIPIFLLATSCPLLNLWSERPQPVNNITPSAVPCIVLTGSAFTLPSSQDAQVKRLDRASPSRSRLRAATWCSPNVKSGMARNTISIPP
ncbi:hypothetical protein TFLX_03496 [Thermoflexales bacterium]|nr:hypothetical protein TFLX_03496 [Thermoflexales bacterium]